MRKIIRGLLKLPFSYLKRKKKKKIEVKRNISGEWYFTDQNKHKHHLILSNNLNIIIDHNKLDTKLVENNPDSIVFIDKYGYILKIMIHNDLPVSIYDEAENVSYKLIISKNDIKKH